jgi:hypothetical protein
MTRTTSPAGAAAPELSLPNPVPAPPPVTPGTFNPPLIFSATPDTGVPGTGVTLGGSGLSYATEVVFVDAAGKAVDAVFFNVNDSQLAVEVPAVAAGLYQITVATNPPGQGPLISNKAPFTVQALPALDGFDPLAGAVGNTITIRGKHLGGVTEVDFNGVRATKLKIVGGEQITAGVPPGATTGPIRVVAPTGTATSATSFVVVTAAPTISSLVPASGPVGTKVVVNGTQLLGLTAVTIGGQPAKFTPDKERQFTTKIPAGLQPGTVNVVVTNGLGSATAKFTVTAH